MRDTIQGIIERLASAPDYWAEARRAVAASESLDGMLPASRALPDCPLALDLVSDNVRACRALLRIIQAEAIDSHVFKNAVFVLMYSDSLFVYRGLKEIYPTVPDGRQQWIDVACRKMILRCMEVPKDSQAELTREIVRNTCQGRLATTEMMAAEAAEIWEHTQRSVTIRDIAVSDGITTLDLYEATAALGIPALIKGTDLRLYLTYADDGGDRVVAHSDGSIQQLEIDSTLYGLRHEPLSAVPAGRLAKPTGALVGPAAVTITMLAPRVEAEANPDRLFFGEENAFDPQPDIADANIIRVANLFVERTEDHRGYYRREDIIAAIAALGRRARDGTHLFVDNFRKKIEHIGHWRKDESRKEWVRIPVHGDVVPDLAGIENIQIDSQRQVKG